MALWLPLYLPHHLAFAHHPPQTLQTPRGGAESCPFYRYRAAVAADVARNDQTGGKYTADCQSYPLSAILCLVNLAGVSKRFRAGFRAFGRDDLHA